MTNDTFSNETGILDMMDGMNDMLSTTTESPTEDGTVIEAESEAPIVFIDADETAAPSEEKGPATNGPSAASPGTDSPSEETADETDAPSILEDSETESPSESAETSVPSEAVTEQETIMVMDKTTMPETLAPTLRGTMQSTSSTSLVDVELDDGGINATNLDDVAQEQVGNVTLETDTTDAPIVTEAPTQAEVETEAPTEPKVVTEAPTEAPVETPAPVEVVTTEAPTAAPIEVTTEVPVVATPDTAAPTETPATQGPFVTTPPQTSGPAVSDAKTCAVQLANTDPVCGQLLKFTTATCDCYNFCSGKLIGCLAYGEKNSFSCSGETVGGCEASQKIVTSAAPPQRLLTPLSILVAAALPAIAILV